MPIYRVVKFSLQLNIKNIHHVRVNFSIILLNSFIWWVRASSSGRGRDLIFEDLRSEARFGLGGQK